MNMNVSIVMLLEMLHSSASIVKVMEEQLKPGSWRLKLIYTPSTPRSCFRHMSVRNRDQT